MKSFIYLNVCQYCFTSHSRIFSLHEDVEILNDSPILLISSPKIIGTPASSISNVYAFSSITPLDSVCHVDLSVKPEIPGNHTLCVKAMNQRFVWNNKNLEVSLFSYFIFWKKSFTHKTTWWRFLGFLLYFSQEGETRCYVIQVVTKINQTFGMSKASSYARKFKHFGYLKDACLLKQNNILVSSLFRRPVSAEAMF